MYPTFQVFRPHFDALARVAYFRIVPKPASRLKHVFHEGYRAAVWVLVFIYNLQHVIRVIQTRHSTEQIVNTLFVLLTTLSMLAKQIAFNVRSARIDRLIATIEGPLFASVNAYHEGIVKEHAREMSRLLKLDHSAIFICGTLFATFPSVNRALGEAVEFTGYFPFDTNNLNFFIVAVAFNSIVLTFQAYGNSTLDCTIVAFFAQSQIQLRMLRYDLEHLVDPEKKDGKIIKSVSRTFRDIEEPALERLFQKRLAHCVERYKLILWYASEVQAVFDEAMVMQFFVSAWVVCMTVYKIVDLSLLSAEFMTMAMYLCCVLFQLFIYCFYGTQVKYESEFLNDSVYCCEWMSLSPRLRRALLVLMVRGSRAVAPRTAFIIPLSLETYIAVLRASYTLFTFLEQKK